MIGWKDIKSLLSGAYRDVYVRTSLKKDEEASALIDGEIGCAGEYEIKDIEVRGFQEANESTTNMVRTVYLVQWEDLKFACLGELSALPEGAVMKEISEVDVLLLPVAGPGVMAAGDAAKLVRQIEPSVVIPSHFSKWQDFAKELGQQKVEPQEKFVFKKKELIPKEMKLVILEG